MFSKLLKEIEDLSITYKYKPLNNELKEKYHKLYKDNLNGFETKRNLNINNIPIAKKYERIVIGDYGAYVEFLPEDLLVELKVTKGQEWRLDKEFIKKRNLNLKYEWYEYQGYKVYLQTNTVTYADYKPGYYYISVLYFDIINKEDNMFMKNEYAWLSNMCLFPKPIIINNEKIKSSEHYYHSRKTTDPVLRKQILDMDNPYEVKKFCKTIKIRDDWEDIKISVMEEASNIKYSITYFRLKLIACKEPIIEENKHYDIFWGTCNGKGENHHGKILSKLREKLIKEESIKKSNIFFTGIGSRRTPRHIGFILKEFTKYLTMIGYTLRSGGAPGADLDCESGVVNNLKEIYIPWKGFNGSDSTLYTKEDSEESIKIASENHPAYDYLKPPVKKLMNRNVYQVLGYDLKTPSSFVICYTPDGCKSHLTRTNKTGGTGLAISVASKNKIPIINLGNIEDLNWVISLLNIEKKLLDIGNEAILFKDTFNKDIIESLNLWLEDNLNLKDECDFLNKYIPLHLKPNIITVVNNELIGNNKLEYYAKESHE